ncbi:AraC family transcriptional regulator [Paenibacillus darwinianus]|uniref:AraC family transcriptional regulator n=1 Tax=Paenibacillus darwinianus TaxID=1380763 RepID=UPI001680AEA7|nr:AraC family transcriptional regulator [Paenibacillus darwinianus]
MRRRRSITVTRVGEEVGYPDVSHFMQVFRKYYTTTPGQYRADGGGTPCRYRNDFAYSAMASGIPCR